MFFTSKIFFLFLCFFIYLPEYEAQNSTFLCDTCIFLLDTIRGMAAQNASEDDIKQFAMWDFLNGLKKLGKIFIEMFA